MRCAMTSRALIGCLHLMTSQRMYIEAGKMADREEEDGRVPLLYSSSRESIDNNVHEEIAVDSTESNFRHVEESGRNNNARNLIAFWVLGLCNNYAYVIMLSSAHDILTDKPGNGTGTSVWEVDENKECNNLSTGTILLADVLPSLIIKICAPFITVPTFARMTAVLTLSLLSFITVALSPVKWLTFIGVVFASLSSGLGELTLLAYSARFHKNVVSTWSSGTGASGVVGSLSYAGLIGAGLAPKTTLLAMSIIPVTMALSFFCLLKHPSRNRDKWCCDREQNGVDNNIVPQRNGVLSFKRKLRILKGLLAYMMPLSLVYFAEYFINQGLMEHIYFPNSKLNRADQYRWFQVDYQLGVFISRSSVNFITINKLWALPLLQFINLTIFLTEAIFLYLPSIWLVIVLVFFEGLLGGAAYVNTFYKMTQEVPEVHREFSLGAASMADSVGIAVAGAVALPVHSALCNFHG